MATSKRTPKATFLERSWTWLLGLGVLFLALGILGMGMVVRLTLVSILFLGILFEIAGIAQFIDVFKCKRAQGSIWHALVALFYMLMGGLIILDPVLASSVITLLIAWTLIVVGISRFIMAVSWRVHTAGWAFLLIGSLMSTLLGILILAHWPASGLWVIGLFISIELIVSGWSYIFFAIAIRKKSQ